MANHHGALCHHPCAPGHDGYQGALKRNLAETMDARPIVVLALPRGVWGPPGRCGRRCMRKTVHESGLSRLSSLTEANEFDDLLRLAKKGDADAFAGLWRLFQPGLLRYLRV